MENINEIYGKKGTIKPCVLNKDDLLTLTAIIQETFTKNEIKRHFHISTSIANTRIFANSLEGLFKQQGLPDRITDLAFWIESWDSKGDLEKNILLDFSKYSIKINVEGNDSAWVDDKYLKIHKYLETKTVWYWPLISMERFITFVITLMLISSIVISRKIEEVSYNIVVLALVIIWIFFVFYDTRKIWPYANIRPANHISIFSKENIITIAIMTVLIATLIGGTIWPLLKMSKY
jgi:hypothetical protein